MNSTEHTLYPLELSLNRIKKRWGGWPGKVGEIWSLSASPHESLVLNGLLAGQRLTDIVGEFHEKLLGKNMELDPREPFPLLLKFISTGKNLPIQVHPHDAYTMETGLPMVGRDKLFYILNAKQEKRIYLGFKKKLSKKEIRDAVAEGTLHRRMNIVTVKPGEVYTIPAGRVHAIGRGITLFEIQRHSDLTFTLSDWNNRGGSKNKSKRHINEALKVLDLKPLTPGPISKINITSDENRIEYLALTPYFILRRLVIRKSFDVSLKGNRFMVYTGLRGAGWLRWGFSDIYSYIQPYQSILVPAIREDLFFESEDKLEVLETSVPDLAGGILDHIISLGVTPSRLAGLGGGDYGRIIKEYMR